MQRDIADPPTTAELQTDTGAPGAERPEGDRLTPPHRRTSRWALALEALVV
jgi:hypothetical protein